MESVAHSLPRKLGTPGPDFGAWSTATLNGQRHGHSLPSGQPLKAAWPTAHLVIRILHLCPAAAERSYTSRFGTWTFQTTFVAIRFNRSALLRSAMPVTSRASSDPLCNVRSSSRSQDNHDGQCSQHAQQPKEKYAGVTEAANHRSGHWSGQKERYIGKGREYT